jgi:hypothetical protein
MPSAGKAFGTVPAQRSATDTPAAGKTRGKP